MKKLAVSLVFLLTHSANVESVDVRLESLEAFDLEVHKISVTVQDKSKGGCLPSSKTLKTAYETLLAKHGFKLAPLKESHLEFAVLVEGFTISGPHHCGLRVKSMARQVPLKKILRMPPTSESTRYQLWVVENLLTGVKSEMQAMAQAQATQDVFDFYRYLGSE